MDLKKTRNLFETRVIAYRTEGLDAIVAALVQ
jgi:hypothetical protein